VVSEPYGVSSDGSAEKLGKEMTAMDAEHTEALKRILKEIGFPTISKVGRDCAQYAWLIVILKYFPY